MASQPIGKVLVKLGIYSYLIHKPRAMQLFS